MPNPKKLLCNLEWQFLKITAAAGFFWHNGKPMLRNIQLALPLIFVAFAHGQTPGKDARLFAGCYEVTSLNWMPPNATIKLIPKRFELLDTARDPDAFDMRSLPAEPFFDRLRRWRPTSKDKLWLSFSTGLGGFKGTIKKSGEGEFAGKLKEWCDSRCGWHKNTGVLRVRRVACGPN